ncbi:MAG TPA: hypothetical protein VKA27_10515 [Sunxiuqinia sp.]|nr:hypothetical protein [Sunxiuqinia sp.]
MKLIKNILVAAAAIAILAACTKKDEPVADQSIAGTYLGTLTASSLKSTSSAISGHATATSTVTQVNDSMVEVHCFNDDLDTTFTLNFFNDNDSVIVCMNNSAFNAMYDEMMGHGGMMGGMMGGWTNHQSGETDWQYFRNNFPQADTLQMGGFDRMNHTFGYQFGMMNGDTPYNLTFQGTKR